MLWDLKKLSQSSVLTGVNGAGTLRLDFRDPRGAARLDFELQRVSRCFLTQDFLEGLSLHLVHPVRSLESGVEISAVHTRM